MRGFAFHNVLLAGLLFSLVACPVSEERRTEKVAIGILQDSLRQENFFVRSAGLKAIGEMGDPALIPSLIAGFRDPVSFVRLFAVESVAQLHGPDTLKLLLAAGKDPDPMVRVAVVKALDDLSGAKGVVDAVPTGSILTPFTKDPDPTVHLFAWAALARYGNPQGWTNLFQAAEIPETAPSAMVALGRTKKQEALPALVSALNAPEEMTRTLAAEALGEIAVQEAYGPLIGRITEDKASTVRGAAATALGKIKDPRAIPILTRAVNDLEPKGQIAVAEGLMRLGIKRWDLYEKALHHTDYGVRHFAIGSLQKVADPGALPLLIRALKDEAPRVRIAAVRAIGAVGGKNEAPLLEKMLRDADLSVRAYAAGNVVRLLRLTSKQTR